MPVNFRLVLRSLLLSPLLVLSAATYPQTLSSDTTAAISFSRSISVPLNSVKLFDKATDAWNWTFGQEPGAQLLRSERENGILEGNARVNFRSQMLSNREESMGVIQYRIIINVKAGECRTTVTELTHHGNYKAPRNGVHLGLLTRSMAPLQRVPGMSRGNSIRLYTEVKELATQRVQELMRAFDARLRAGETP